jgi:hypothetical protein
MDTQEMGREVKMEVNFLTLERKNLLSLTLDPFGMHGHFSKAPVAGFFKRERPNCQASVYSSVYMINIRQIS